MATAKQVYLIPDSDPTSTAPSTGLGPADIFHVFRSKDGWLTVAAIEPRVSGVQNISAEFSCDIESFLYAAAVAECTSPDAKTAYLRIISGRDLGERFESICETRDAVIIDHLEAVLEQWQTIIISLDDIERQAPKWSVNCLYGSLLLQEKALYLTRDIIRGSIAEHPECWRAVLDVPLPAVADCVGRIRIFLTDPSWPESLDDIQRSMEPFKLVRERCEEETRELKARLARLEARRHSHGARPILTERPTVYQSLLHLCLILCRCDYPVVRRLRKETDVVSWQHSDWKERCSQLSHLSDDDYEGLACTLSDFAPFEKIELTGKRVKNQVMALMAKLKASAGEITHETGSAPRASDEFSVHANIMLLCAPIGIFAIVPELEGDVLRRTDPEDHAAELSLSPLYQNDAITAKSAKSELAGILFCLEPQHLSIQTAKDGLSVGSHSLSPGRQRLLKRPSYDSIDDANEKRQRRSEEAVDRCSEPRSESD
ncbi:uncharacterized protein CIMG_13169 [Coccidioides immitis RS]|uniref:Uncharacterized protein n=1 Tax=Coccidioides immitis (strain RS) TaxID=246410 RepID=A0A0E1RW96_COCIM|nr:uncharacterized protein CIMG_13169 [Coccidioides immitis RS]EAS30009.1 hypothetical protein CIMG_13169 [Coccidioides immitis RS]